MIEIYSCDNYSFSSTQAYKAWDVVFTSGKCPKCNSDFKSTKKTSRKNQSQNAIVDNNKSQRAHNYYDFIQGPQRKP